jgi:cardiolipin synthase
MKRRRNNLKHLPNLLTTFRLLLVPVYFFVFFSGIPHHMMWGFGIFLLAGLTDILDGYLARKFKLVTELGIILDPLADKLMMLSVILSLVISGVIQWWLAVLVFLRDLGMIVGGALLAVGGHQPIPADRWGKATTFFFYVAIFLIVFDVPYSVHFLGVVICFSFFTSWNYLQKGRQQRIAS